MKKSNKVILTAVFLSAISAATSQAQTVKDTSNIGQPQDSTVSYNDSSAYYNDSAAYYRDHPAPVPYRYVYDEPNGFWWRVRVFFRFGFYGRRWHERHQATAGRSQTHPASGPRQSGQSGSGLRKGESGSGPRVAQPAGSPRSQGFGQTMHKSHSSAAS